MYGKIGPWFVIVDVLRRHGWVVASNLFRVGKVLPTPLTVAVSISHLSRIY